MSIIRDTVELIRKASSSLVANTLVRRDDNGDIAVSNVIGALVGNASTATKLATTRTISLSGDSTGSGSFDGSDNLNIVVTRDINKMLTDILSVDGSGSGIDADLLDGYHASQAESVNTVATRTSLGYLYSGYFNSSNSFSTSGMSSGIVNFIGTNGSDTFARSYTNAAVASTLSGQTMNINGSSTSCTGNAVTATTASNANKLIGMNWSWSGQGGQPAWLWGGSDGTNVYVYNPSNFSVNYANSAGTLSGGVGANVAAIGAGTVGSYSLWYSENTFKTVGENYAGSSFGLSGTWRCMGSINLGQIASNIDIINLMLRIA